MCSYSWRVPFHAFGELKIVASCDIGGLGPKEGTAVIYNWNLLYNVIGLLPLFLLLLAFVVLKENRCLQALWILLPVIFPRLLLAGLAKIFGIPSEALAMFTVMIDTLLIGLVLNWLLADRIGNRNRFVTWLLAWGLYGLVFAVTMFCFGVGTGAIQISIFLGLTVGILMVSFALAGFVCRKRFGPVRFSIWTAVWVLLTTIGFFAIFGIIQAVMHNMPLGMIIMQILMVGLIYGGMLIVGLLPFEIVLFVNSFWRKRFEAVFGLKVPTPPAFEPEVPATSPEE